METAELIRLLNKELPINFAERKSYDEVKDQLAEYINHLINHDFDKLITYLYRIDVSEQKLKLRRHENQQEDAAHIIAALIIEILLNISSCTFSLSSFSLLRSNIVPNT